MAKTKRSSAQGATRKRQAPTAPVKRNFAWVNRLMILIGVGVVLAAGLQAYIYLQTIPVERIAVTGKLENTRTEEVQDMVQPALAGGFLYADLQAIREQLQALPWIYRATVHRRWPNALEIHVVEQLPIARWGKSSFLNHQGEVFDTQDSSQWNALPQLDGPEGSAAELVLVYQRLAELLAPIDRRLLALSMDSRLQLRAQLSGDMELVLGDDDFSERVRRFVRLYQGELGARKEQLARVDLRYDNGLAVGFREPAQVAGL